MTVPVSARAAIGLIVAYGSDIPGEAASSALPQLPGEPGLAGLCHIIEGAHRPRPPFSAADMLEFHPAEREMAKERTAARIARYDQSLAGASTEIDRLVEILRSKAAEVDDHIAGSEPGEVAGLLTAAIWQLAGVERKAEIDRLVGILRSKAAEVDEVQALTELCALFAGSEPAEVADLLKAAIWRLAGLERQDEIADGPAGPSSGAD